MAVTYDEYGNPVPSTPMLGNPPALSGPTTYQQGMNRQPAQQGMTREPAPMMMDPKRALWAGTIMDIGNYIGSKGRRPMQGLGPQMMMNIENQNYQRQQYAAATEEDRRRWESEYALERQDSINRAMGETGVNVQSRFEGQNGNVWYLTEAGETVDTGVPYRQRVQYETLSDGSIVALDAMGKQIGYTVSPEQAREAEVRATMLEDQLQAQLNLPESIASAESQIAQGERLIGNIDEAIDLVSPWTTGMAGAALDIPGTPSRALRATISTIQARLAFDQLSAMRAASPTGGALGQVSERELNLLMSAVESLDPTLDDKTLLRNLKAVQRHYANWLDTVRQDAARTQQRAGVEVAPIEPSEPIVDEVWVQDENGNWVIQ